ncbi:MAG: hypothetical protein HAW58_03065 [Candidatus Thioglobus sp.]|nr:hypothetical protein [Candidatus Thioglobus sp.]
MQNIKILILTSLLTFGGFTTAQTQKTQTHNWKDAKDLVLQADDFVRQNGVKSLLKNINEGGFTTANSYVFMLDSSGFLLAHPYRKDLIGTNRALKANYIIRMISIVGKYSSGWIDYSFTDPKTDKTTPKLSFVKRISPSVFIGAGVY